LATAVSPAAPSSPPAAAAAAQSAAPVAKTLPIELRRLLARMKWAIRGYATLDGLSSLVLLVAAGFYLLWLVDWWFEPSWPTRRTALAILALAAAVVLFLKIGVRVARPLSAVSLAMLVERRFAAFGDRLITAVELHGRPLENAAAATMLAQTTSEARSLARGVRLRAAFKLRPLIAKSAAAAMLVVATLVVALVARDSFSFYLARLQGSVEPWPRQTLLLVDGFWSEFALVVPREATSGGKLIDKAYVYAGQLHVDSLESGGTSLSQSPPALSSVVAPFDAQTPFALPQSGQRLATLRRMEDCLWQGDARDRRPGARLAAGRYELVDGRAELLFSTGVLMTVQGPAAFRLDSSSAVELEFGAATFRAPLAESPLQVTTPRAVYTAEPPRSIKVVRGGDVTITALVDALGKLPDYVEATYRGAAGGAGREILRQEAAAIPGRDEFQRYTLTLKNVLGSIDLNLAGGDGRAPAIAVEAVDSPKLASAVAACRYPDYLVDARSGRFTPRELPIAGPLEVPQGTHVTLRARASKPLRSIDVSDGTLPRTIQPLADDPSAFQLVVGALAETKTLFLTLHDADGVANREPIPIQFVAVPDEPPRVAVRLFGVGTAITPNAMLRLAGDVTDDYALQSAAFALSVEKGGSIEQPLAMSIAGQRSVAFAAAPWRGPKPGAATPAAASAPPRRAMLDLAALRLPDGRALVAGDQISVSVKATDRCTLRGAATAGEGDRTPLEVVTPDELISRLDAREVLLREKLETIIEELERTRDALGELKTAELKTAELKTAETPIASATAAPSRPAPPRRAAAPQVERAVQNAERSTYETSSLVSALDEIGEELAANRLDAPQRRAHLGEELIEPLAAVVANRYPKFAASLAPLRQRAMFADNLALDRQSLVQAAGKGDAAAPLARSLAAKIAAAEGRIAAEPPLAALVADAQREADAVVVGLRAVLAKLADAGDYNQLVEELRDLARRQEDLRQRTRKQQKRSLLD
jgi:hypothetical protein